MKKKILFSIVLLSFSLLFVVFFAELFLRIRSHELFDFDNFFVKYRKTRSAVCVVEFDENLGWSAEPNVKLRHNNYRTRVSTKEHGLRTNAEANKVNASNPPILSVGDSFVFGDQVSNEETWPSYLENQLETSVLNAGMCSYGMDQAYLRAKQLVDIYKPSTLIFSYTSYDIPRTKEKFNPDTFGNHYKPYFEKENGNFVLKAVPLATPKDIHNLDLPLVHSILGRSAFFSFVFNKAFPDYWWSVKLPARKADVTNENAVEVSCHVVKLLSELALEKKIRVILLPQPFYEQEPADTDVLEQVMACGRKNSVEILDISNALSQVKKTEKERFDTFYFSYLTASNTVEHGHMTATGNEFVAKQISQYLKTK